MFSPLSLTVLGFIIMVYTIHFELMFVLEVKNWVEGFFFFFFLTSQFQMFPASFVEKTFSSLKCPCVFVKITWLYLSKSVLGFSSFPLIYVAILLAVWCYLDSCRFWWVLKSHYVSCNFVLFQNYFDCFNSFVFLHKF